MDREPKISELEKLIKHFRESGREEELLEILKFHGINREEIIPVIEEGTHEFHPEAIALNNIAEKEGFLKRSRGLFGRIKNAYRQKWYFRYSVYFLTIFILIFGLLNLPIVISRLSYKETKTIENIVEEKPETKDAPLEPGEVIPSFSQVVIPKINVKAPIIFVETRDEKTIQSNLTNGVVHYAGTAVPGEVGNSFITGHSSNYWWVKGNYNYVFVNLDKLNVGDQAKIYYKGKKFVYQVKSKAVVAPTDTSVLAATDVPTLTLMTCTPPGTNWKRLIIKLDQIAPTYEKPRMVTKKIEIENPDKLPTVNPSAIWDWFLNLFK